MTNLGVVTLRQHNCFLQVKNTFKSLPAGELALRAQRKTLEKMRRNIAGTPTLLKTNEIRMVQWLKEYGGKSS